MHSEVKPFQERNTAVIGAIGAVAIAAVAVAAFNFTTLVGYFTDNTYTAYFDEAGGLTTGAAVQVSGYVSGQVRSIGLEPQGVLVTFTVADDIRLGEQTEAAIKTKSLLGNKVVEVTPRGKGHLSGPIPITRTHSPYQLTDAIGDLSSTISGLHTQQLSDSLRALSDTLRDTPPQLKAAVQGVARFSDTLDQRDAQLRQLLANASKATTVLSQRTDEIVRLIHDTNSLLAQLRTQSAALDQISGNVSESGPTAPRIHRREPHHAQASARQAQWSPEHLDNRKVQLQQTLKGVDTYLMALGETLTSGPFFKAYVQNLLPGQFVQPFVDAAFSDLGLGSAHTLPQPTCRPADWSTRHAAVADALPEDGAGRPAESEVARCDHR